MGCSFRRVGRLINKRAHRRAMVSTVPSAAGTADRIGSPGTRTWWTRPRARRARPRGRRRRCIGQRGGPRAAEGACPAPYASSLTPGVLRGSHRLVLSRRASRMGCMPVPGFQTFMLPLLRALDDGADHPMSELRERIAGQLALTEADRAELLPSGSGNLRQST